MLAMSDASFRRGRAAVKRGRLFALLFSIFFGILFFSDVIARISVSATGVGDNFLLRLFGLDASDRTLWDLGLMLLIGIVLFAASTVLLKVFPSMQ
jgi:hypothetical protein